MKKIIFLVFVLGIVFLFGCEQQKTEEKSQIANPASVHCIDNGGTLKIVTGDKGQYGICTLPDGTECEEWAYFRGECPIPQEEMVVCTMETKLCPDGSSVGRNPDNNCEFDPCPGEE